MPFRFKQRALAAAKYVAPVPVEFSVIGNGAMPWMRDRFGVIELAQDVGDVSCWRIEVFADVSVSDQFPARRLCDDQKNVALEPREEGALRHPA
jgi:hypothetical protein